MQHTPGTVDKAVQFVWQLKPAEIQTVIDQSANLISVLGAAASELRARDSYVERIAYAVSQGTTATAFIERAAMLHADAAMFDSRQITASADRLGSVTATVIGVAGVEQLNVRPLAFGLARDGDLMGRTGENWNWRFARELLQKIRDREGDAFRAEWYHATTAYLFVNAFFGEASTHLQEARKVLPDDPLILFDRACLAETLATNLFQALAADDRAAKVFNQPVWRDPVERSVDLPSAKKLNAAAEKLFRRALAGNPKLPEAAVRLARVLGLHGEDAEAIEQVRRALDAGPTPDVSFYAHLFAARSETSLGHLDLAAGHVSSALKLFPHADSALLAASHVALLKGEWPAAFGHLHEMVDLPLAERSGLADPWILYPYGAGRLVVPLLSKLWQLALVSGR